MQQPNERFTNKDSFNVLCLVMASHATSITVFTHTGFGTNALGKRGLAALVLLVMVAAFAGSSFMGWYILAFLVASLVQRIATAKMSRAGQRPHSLSDGRPFLIRLVRNERTARTLEAFLCAVAGVGIAVMGGAWQMPQLAVPAVYVGLGCISLAFDDGMSEAAMQQRVEAMRDARLENEALLRRFTEGEDQ
jgi:hypothetical protein